MENKQQERDPIRTLTELIQLEDENKLPAGQLLFDCYLNDDKKALNVIDKVHIDTIRKEKIFRRIYTQSASAVRFRGIKTKA